VFPYIHQSLSCSCSSSSEGRFEASYSVCGLFL
jgi:hypothetical protein